MQASLPFFNEFFFWFIAFSFKIAAAVEINLILNQVNTDESTERCDVIQEPPVFFNLPNYLL
jgi:hypothetical protein